MITYKTSECVDIVEAVADKIRQYANGCGGEYIFKIAEPIHSVWPGEIRWIEFNEYAWVDIDGNVEFKHDWYSGMLEIRLYGIVNIDNVDIGENIFINDD